MSLGVALGNGEAAQLEAIPWDHLLAIELLSLATWVLLSLPGLSLIRAAASRLSSRSHQFAVAVLAAFAFALLFAAVEQGALQLVLHPHQERLADAVLPDLDTRILAFLVMAAMTHTGTRRAPRTRDDGPRATGGPTRPLMTQLQSHFLFNTLNDAAELVHVDPDAADEVITRLSEFLRAALVHTGHELVALGQELGFMRAYSEIQAVRLRGQLAVDWDIAPDTLEAAVPIFVWQPLLENAFRYGADPATGRVTVEIGARRDGTDLVLWIRDRGPGLGEGRNASGQGIGLPNTRDRVARLFGASGSLDVQSVDGGVLAVLRLPFSAYRGAPATTMLP